VQVDEGRSAGRLRIAVCHSDNDGFLQAKDVLEVIGQVAKQRQFGRTGVAENPRTTVVTQQLDRGFSYSRYELSQHLFPTDNARSCQASTILAIAKFLRSHTDFV